MVGKTWWQEHAQEHAAAGYVVSTVRKKGEMLVVRWHPLLSSVMELRPWEPDCV